MSKKEKYPVRGTKYPVRGTNPVVSFHYQGQSHTHPVRKLGLVVEETKDIITIYELRDGNTVRSFSKAPIKSFRKDKIAKVRQCRWLRERVAKKQQNESTLKRMTTLQLIKNGV